MPRICHVFCQLFFTSFRLIEQKGFFKECGSNFVMAAVMLNSTAIPYRASTGPEQGFPCEVFLTGKNLFSLQGTPFLIAGTLFSLQGFPFEKNFTGKTLFSLQGMGLQCGLISTLLLRSSCIVVETGCCILLFSLVKSH